MHLVALGRSAARSQLSDGHQTDGPALSAFDISTQTDFLAGWPL